MSAPNPSLCVSDPQAYRQNLLKLLGERNPVEVLAETPGELSVIARQHSPSTLRTRPYEGKWTPNEIIGHLTDGEWVYGCRLRLILSEDDPPILGTNQDLWVARQRHNERDPTELVETFGILRQFNLELLKRLSPDELKRTGRHDERGPESLGLMLHMLAGHDLSHVNQINRYLHVINQMGQRHRQS